MKPLLTDRIQAVTVDQKLAALIEQAAQQLQRGESIDLSQLAQEQPSHADALRDLLPTIAAMVRLTPEPDDASNHPGKLGKYQLMAKLGEGGMGTVYMAMHSELQKIVALKVLRANRMNDAGAVARFRREMKAAGRFDHHHIVRASDAGEEQGTHFLVMEYVDGCDLSRLVRRIGPLPIADACQIIHDTALGLEFAHQNGLVHRDVKPSNIMLTKQGQVKILDLGLALLDDHHYTDADLTATGQMIGTIDYMAPEQGSDSHAVDCRVDVYSLGATLYQLLTGQAPFASVKFDTLMKKMNALAMLPATPVDELRTNVPKPLAAIISRMLAKNPGDRFRTAAEVAAALEPFKNGSDLAALLHQASGTDAPAPIDRSTISTSNQFRPEASSTIDTGPRPAKLLPSLRVIPAQRRKRLLLIAAGLLGPLVVAGVVLIIRDHEGKEKLRVALDNGDKVEIVPHEDESKASPPAHQRPASAGHISIFAPNSDENVLRNVFLPLVNKSGHSASFVESLNDAMKNKPSVLVVVLNETAYAGLGGIDLQQLKSQRIVGIGHGAAKLFGDLGLAINASKCAHGTHETPNVLLIENSLLDISTLENPFYVFSPRNLDAANFHNEHFFGVHIGDSSQLENRVEVLGIQAHDNSYASIARESRHVLVCVDAPVANWSMPLKSLLSEVTIRLARASNEALDAKVTQDSLRELRSRGRHVPAPNQQSAASAEQFILPPRVQPDDTLNRSLAIYVGYGAASGPGAVMQVSPTGEFLGMVHLDGSPTGMASCGDTIFAAIPSHGEVVRISADGAVEAVDLGEIREHLKRPTAIACLKNADGVLIADSDGDVIARVAGARSVGNKIVARIPGEPGHIQDISVATLSDGQILYAGNDLNAVYRFDTNLEATIDEPLIHSFAYLAAHHASTQWVAMLDQELKVFDGADMRATFSYPVGRSAWLGFASYAPDGKLVTALHTGSAFDVYCVDLKSGKFHQIFTLDFERLKSLTVAPKMAWLKK